MVLIVVNAGSSSLKLAMFDMSQQEAGVVGPDPFWQANLTWSNGVRIRGHCRGAYYDDILTMDADKAARAAVMSAWTGAHAGVKSRNDIERVGHRVVHGGMKYSQSSLVTDEVLNDLRSFTSLAPLHEPANIRFIELLQSLLPGISQVAVFDTAYFHNLPESSKRYPVPSDWHESYGIRRFGFHGISHQYCACRAAQMLGVQSNDFRVITCHIGAGASITLSQGGRSIATTMGFTPMEGVIMATRCGSIDPGLILYLLQNGKLSVEQMHEVLNFKSGLQGICGESDMRVIEAASAAGDERASLALEMFTRSICAHIGSLMTVAGGADAIVFAGGIGENSSRLRAAVASSLNFLGMAIDAQKNVSCRDDLDISAAGARLQTLVVCTKEELAIARASLETR